jgi:hypothetical protein
MIGKNNPSNRKKYFAKRIVISLPIPPTPQSQKKRVGKH